MPRRTDKAGYYEFQMKEQADPHYCNNVSPGGNERAEVTVDDEREEGG